MVIRYVAPDACSALKVEVPSASNGRDSPVTSFFNTIGESSAPVPKPETDAPIVQDGTLLHCTGTVTLALILPVPLLTKQFDPLDCSAMVTS